MLKKIDKLKNNVPDMFSRSAKLLSSDESLVQHVYNVGKSKSIKKDDLIKKIKLYKNKNCNIYKSVHLMQKSTIKKYILKLDSSYTENELKDLKKKELKKIYKEVFSVKCKINLNSSKDVLLKFAKNNNII